MGTGYFYERVQDKTPMDAEDAEDCVRGLCLGTDRLWDLFLPLGVIMPSMNYFLVSSDSLTNRRER